MRIRTPFLLPLMMMLALALSACAKYTKPMREQASRNISTQYYYVLETHSDTRFSNEMQPQAYLHDNACALLAERPHWRTALQDVQNRWNIAPEMILAFLYQESRFNPTALSRSKAYGYAQIKDESWDWYLLKTQNVGGGRERFDDAIDFIGFYANQNVKRNQVAINDVKNQYLAYHEGMGGFEKGSFLGKPWLLSISDKVSARAKSYQAQLAKCPI